jgi:hydrogenase-4 component F
MLFSFAGFIFLFEVSRTTSGEGTLNWTVLMQHASAYPPGMMTVVFILVFIGFAAKSGIFPFHTWLPDAHAKAPSAVSAVLSGVLLNIGIYAILRMTAIIHLNPASAVASQVMMVFGIFTLGIAALSMLPQKNLKKLIAFSSIENMGLMVIGCAVMTPLAIFWVIFHIMAHAFTKAGLFFSAGILHRQYHSPFSGDAPDEIQEVFRLQPLAAWGIILGGLAITAIPPSPLFFSEIFILAQLGTQSLFLAILVLLLLFIAVASLGYFIIVAFTRKQENSNGDSHSAGPAPYRTPVGMKVPIIILVIAVAMLGILVPGPVSGLIHQIVAELRF